jgi:malto-oligosyltrehalose trehalohydrolase
MRRVTSGEAESVRRRHRMPFGAELRADGAVRFRLWAPAQDRVMLEFGDLSETAAMTALPDGWHEHVVAGAAAGMRYRFRLEDGTAVPDPASRHQPQDVHGPSEVIDPAAYAWRDGDWRGRPWHEAVLYELHVGTFTPDGTFRAATERLDHLVELGVTAVEVMPVADFPGRRNWGYDGVLLFAPDGRYGRPEDFKAFIDAAHGRGLMVLLDVVYNHFGPEGNYLPLCAPQMFSERHETPWGAAINYDGIGSPTVRDFMCHNALYWLEEFHLDGLRLDAVHAIIDDGPTHVLQELASRVRQTLGPRRHIHLILENDENEACWLQRRAGSPGQAYTAQWNDDVHHGLHTAATGEAGGYYGEYTGDTEKLARALAEGFAFQGETMAYRGRPRGERSAHLPPTAFVAFIQNHDQIGNRAFGERLPLLAPAEAVRAVAATYLLAPQVPLLFMGEEWATERPFPFFCDFTGDLANAVREGRRAEFARFPEFGSATARERIPDPTAEGTFLSAKLSWDEVTRPPHADWLGWYRRVLAARRREVVPRLADVPGNGGEYAVLGAGAFRVAWRLGDGSRLRLLANLSAGEAAGGGGVTGRTIWREGAKPAAADRLAPWTVIWSIDDD